MQWRNDGAARVLAVFAALALISGCGDGGTGDEPVAAVLARAERALAETRHDEVVRMLEAVDPAAAATADGYRLNFVLASAHAALGDADAAAERVRVMLALDEIRARVDIQTVAAPFFEGPDVAGAGVAFYEALAADLPRAWWVHSNIGTLATTAGDAARAAAATETARALRARGVIVIVVDTLRADHLGAYGYDRATSPNLDAWAAEGRRYEHAYATSPWTLPSFGSIFTAQLPMRHRGGWGFDGTWQTLEPINGAVPVIAELFRNEGFATGAVVNNTFLTTDVGSATERGFEVYDAVAGGPVEFRRADATVDRALELIDQWRDRPFFLLVHFFEPHMDYNPVPPFRGRFTSAFESQFELPVGDYQGIRAGAYDLTDGDREFLRAAYDEEILSVDAHLGRFREALASRGLLGGTDDGDRELLILFTADHGEELLDHGGFEHGHAVWDELIRVPLVVWGEGIAAGRETTPVSLIDLAPTVAEWAGLPRIPGAAGISLWSNVSTGAALPSRTLFAEGLLYGAPQTAIVRWPLKVIVDADEQPVFAADLDADPAERTDVAASKSDAVAALVSEQSTRRRETARQRYDTAATPTEPDAETLERLRSLGYIR